MVQVCANNFPPLFFLYKTFVNDYEMYIRVLLLNNHKTFVFKNFLNCLTLKNVKWSSSTYSMLQKYYLKLITYIFIHILLIKKI